MSSNGAGKSTVPDALDWCLWGVVPRNDHVDSIVNEEAKKDTRVTTYILDDDGNEATITRTRKAPDDVPKLSFTIAGTDHTTLDVAETQKHIERFLGMDREVFHATVLFAQFDLWKFADATDKERIELLTKVLRLGQIDEWLDRTKEVKRRHAELAAHLNNGIANLEGQMQSLEGMDYDAQIASWDAEREERSKELAQRIKDMGELPPLEPFEREVNSITQALTNLPNVEIPELDSIRREHSRAMADERIAMYEAKRLTDSVVALRTKNTGTCPQCGQPVDQSHIQKEIERLSLEAKAAIQQASVAKAQVTQWAAKKDELEEQQRKLQADVKQRGTTLQHALAQAQTKRDGLQAQWRMLESLLADAARVKAEVNPHVAQKMRTKKRIEELLKEKETIQAQVTTLEEDTKYVDFWVDGFGSKGLKSYILDSRLQELTDAANEWVRLLTGGTIWVRFETQTKGRSTNKLSNKINIRVFRYNPSGTISERNYRSWSGGEKQRVSLGVDFGLTRLVAKRASKTYDLIILDEVFKHLDSAGREAVVELLHMLKQEKSTVLVVDHDKEMQGAFENIVTARKKGGRSSIDDGTFPAAPVEEKPKRARKRQKPVQTAVTT